MSDDEPKSAGAKPAKSPAEVRKAKLAAQLRANLQKRKAQSRARRAGEADERTGMNEPETVPARK